MTRGKTNTSVIGENSCHSITTAPLTDKAETLILDLLALVGGATLKADRRTGEITLRPPGAGRLNADELRATLPAVLVSACDLAELCGVEAIETEGLRQFADMIGGAQ